MTFLEIRIEAKAENFDEIIKQFNFALDRTLR